MNAEDVVSPAVERIDAETSVTEADRSMDEQALSCLGATENGLIIGVDCGREIFVRGVVVGADPNEIMALGVMSGDPVFHRPDDDLETVAARMRENKIRRIIAGDNNAPAGMIPLSEIAARAPMKELCGTVIEDVCRPP